MLQTALVLQGGGALGAYEFGAVKRLYEVPGFAPDVIAGVSIGAINAAVLVGARGDPVETLEAMWERFAVISPPLIPDAAEQFLSLFGNLSLFRMRYDFLNALNWTSFYSTEPLRRALDEFVDFEKIRRSRTRLLVTATDIESGAPRVFDNHDPATRADLSAEHIVASAALPPAFPITHIDDRSYWDGGLFSNTPLGPVIDRLDTDPKIRKRIVLVNLFPARGRVPRNMLGVLDRVYELLFACRLRWDIDAVHRVNEFVKAVDAIDAALPADSPIRALPGFRRLGQYKLVRDVIVIENQAEELVFAPFDFSRNAIDRRIEAGYSDADRVMRAFHV